MPYSVFALKNDTTFADNQVKQVVWLLYDYSHQIKKYFKWKKYMKNKILLWEMRKCFILLSNCFTAAACKTLLQQL